MKRKRVPNQIDVEGGVARLTITQLDGTKHTVLIDAADAPLVSQHKWSVMKNRRVTYVYRKSGKKNQYLHRFLMETPAGMEVDHINGSGLDCRRLNMRNVTKAQNSQNLPKFETRTLSRFRGVSRKGAKWLAQVAVGGKTTYVGTFSSELEAAFAAQKARLKHMPFSNEERYGLDEIKRKAERSWATLTMIGLRGVA